MTEKPTQSQPPPKVPSLGIWKTVGQIVEYHLWRAHGALTEAVLHLEARGKYPEQVEELKKLRNELKTIIGEVASHETD